ncbi:MAG TPA: response regulator transcription factor, partial [Longimicrobiales bacterium]|nr:response regulator transcription factor [Longimicrobiales bacterium]
QSDLRVLLLEDSSADAELIGAALSRLGMRLAAHRVDTREAFQGALAHFEPDLVLSDHSLGQFRALDALEVVDEVRPATAFIVVTGSMDEEAMVACIRRGADDYVLKHHLDRLAPAVQVALERRRKLRSLSPRQVGVLRLIAEGRSTREIAEHWNISIKTVETHRAELMRRLDIHDVGNLVRYAVAVRLVRPRL